MFILINQTNGGSNSFEKTGKHEKLPWYL